ncbi:hypothetical protein ACSBR2_028893 [Camellia fascicularis]
MFFFWVNKALVFLVTSAEPPLKLPNQTTIEVSFEINNLFKLLAPYGRWATRCELRGFEEESIGTDY